MGDECAFPSDACGLRHSALGVVFVVVACVIVLGGDLYFRYDLVAVEHPGGGDGFGFGGRGFLEGVGRSRGGVVVGGCARLLAAADEACCGGGKG